MQGARSIPTMLSAIIFLSKYSILHLTAVSVKICVEVFFSMIILPLCIVSAPRTV
jgi:hypothetical protein